MTRTESRKSTPRSKIAVSPSTISAEFAERQFGVSADHEKMPNGEFRFRLKAGDGSGYVRTVAERGGWQNSHFHVALTETYIVQKGWILWASLREGSASFVLLKPGQSVTTEAQIPHNVYLPAGCVVHTVKHGQSKANDWFACEELDELTKPLSEKSALMLTHSPSRASELDARFHPYVDIYNNLDDLIWRVPTWFVAASAILLGFLGTIASSSAATLPALAWSLLFLFVALLFFLSAYTMWRIRIHHTDVGSYLLKLEGDGYFHSRARRIQSWFPPSAPHVFISVFTVMALAFFVLAGMAVFRPAELNNLISEKAPRDAVQDQSKPPIASH